MELIAGRTNLAEVKTQSGILQGKGLSSLLFVIAMMPLSHILRKFTGGYKLTKSQEKKQSPNVHGRLQTVWQNWKRITSNENIQSWHRSGIENSPCL